MTSWHAYTDALWIFVNEKVTRWYLRITEYDAKMVIIYIYIYRYIIKYIKEAISHAEFNMTFRILSNGLNMYVICINRQLDDRWLPNRYQWIVFDA